MLKKLVLGGVALATVGYGVKKLLKYKSRKKIYQIEYKNTNKRKQKK